MPKPSRSPLSAPSSSHSPFDLVVLGAGSGGMAAAKRAAHLGARVAIVESARTGGTCVLRGCVPKKLMVQASHLGHSRKLAAFFGWPESTGSHDFAKLVAARDQVIDGLVESHESTFAKLNITHLKGHASIRAPGTVCVDGGSAGPCVIHYRHLLVATGSEPQLPKLPGSELARDSDAFFTLAHRPQKVIIVGGGYIAVEFATLLLGLGSEVTLLVRSQLLRAFDVDLANTVRNNLRQAGAEVVEGASPEHIEREGVQGLQLAYRENETTHLRTGLDCVLFATGRRPRSRGLGLEALGVTMNEKDAICVDADHQTAAHNVFAIGDVIDRVNLTPVAIRAGRSVAERLFGNKTERVDYSRVPSAVFTQPPAGSVGLTEAEARREVGEQLQVYFTEFSPLTYAPVPKPLRQRTMMKLLVDPTDDRVVGIHLVGDDAPELIQPLAVAMQAGATKQHFDATLAVHPTQAEELVLLTKPRV